MSFTNRLGDNHEGESLSRIWLCTLTRNNIPVDRTARTSAKAARAFIDSNLWAYDGIDSTSFGQSATPHDKTGNILECPYEVVRIGREGLIVEIKAEEIEVVA